MNIKVCLNFDFNWSWFTNIKTLKGIYCVKEIDYIKHFNKIKEIRIYEKISNFDIFSFYLF